MFGLTWTAWPEHSSRTCFVAAFIADTAESKFSRHVGILDDESSSCTFMVGYQAFDEDAMVCVEVDFRRLCTEPSSQLGQERKNLN
jgi:hypothetical protein